MWYIIIALIIFGLIYALFEWLADLVGGAGVLITIIGVLVAAFLAFSWVGVFAVIGIAVAGAIIIAAIANAGTFVSKKVEEHDTSKRETERIKLQTQKEKLAHENDKALMDELKNNCCWLGAMNAEDWKKKLPNYVTKGYSSSFETITSNFAKQIEQQYILQNNEWFEPYKIYVLNHPGGTTVTQMIHEVNCPQLKMTHCTPDGDLINTWMVRGTEKKNADVPPLFTKDFISNPAKKMNEYVFRPTKYLQKLYSHQDTTSTDSAEELDFNDL